MTIFNDARIVTEGGGYATYQLRGVKREDDFWQAMTAYQGKLVAALGGRLIAGWPVKGSYLVRVNSGRSPTHPPSATKAIPALHRQAMGRWQ